MFIAQSRQLGAAAAIVALVASGSLVSAGLATSAYAVAPAASSATDSNLTMSGWIPYWSLESATTSALENADLFTDVSPFWFDAKADESKNSTVEIEETWISSGSRSSVRQSLQEAGLEVLPSITDSTGTLYLAGVLSARSKRTALVAQIVSVVETGQYDGIDLDFETFAFSDAQASWASTKPSWIAFITELSAALHAKGKILAVSVPPMYSDSSGYWVYAFREIGPYIDKLRIMAYDYSWSTAGSIGGPMSWVRALLGYTVDAVGREKVFLGTAAYGRDWVTSADGNGCPKTSGERAKLTRVMHSDSVTFTAAWARDSASQERNRVYTEPYNNGKCTLTRSAWLPDSQTTYARWQIAKEFQIAGLAQWMIGTEQAGQWDVLRSAAYGHSPQTPVPPVSSPAPGQSGSEPSAPPPTEQSGAEITRPISLRAAKIKKKKVVLRGRVTAAAPVTVKILRKTRSSRRVLATAISRRNGKFRVVIRSSSQTLRLKAKSSIGRSASLVVRR